MGVLKTIFCKRAFGCIPLRYATCMLSFIQMLAGVALVAFFGLVNGSQVFFGFINYNICNTIYGDAVDCQIQDESNISGEQTPLNVVRAWIGLNLGIICFITGFLALYGNKERVPCLLYIYIFGALLTLVTGCAICIAILVNTTPAKRVIIQASLTMAGAAVIIGYACLVVGLRCREMKHRDCK